MATAVTVVSPEHSEVTGQWMRSLPMGDIIGDAIGAVARQMMITRLFSDYPGYGIDAANADLRLGQRLATAHRRRVTPELLERVAEIYRSDDSGRPTEAVATALTYSHRNATRLVALAREAGLLEPYKRGARR